MHKDQLCYGEDLRRVANIDGRSCVTSLQATWKSNGKQAFFRPEHAGSTFLMGTDTIRKEI